MEISFGIVCGPFEIGQTSVGADQKSVGSRSVAGRWPVGSQSRSCSVVGSKSLGSRSVARK